MRYLFITLALCCVSITAHADLYIPPAPAPSTVPQYQAATVSTIKQILTINRQTNLQAFGQIFGLLWQNPALTPPQVFAGLGKDGCAAHMNIVRAKNFMKTTLTGANLVALEQIKEPCVVSCKNDGSAVLACPTPSPTPSPSVSPSPSPGASPTASPSPS